MLINEKNWVVCLRTYFMCSYVCGTILGACEARAEVLDEIKTEQEAAG